jgi:hypothetical protein
MPLRATDVVARFDFPRDSATGLAAGRDTLAALLRQAELPARRVELEARPHRTDLAAGLWITAAACLIAASVRRRHSRRRFRSSLRSARALPVAAATAVGLGIAALVGGVDALLPARPSTHFEVAVEPRSAVRREILLGAHYDSKTELFDHRGRALAYVAAALVLVAVTATRRFAVLGAAALVLAAITAGGGRFSGARSHGIVDDAAAVALLVEIAADVHASPLATTRLRCVWWADEEIGAQGSAAWVRQAKLDAVPRVALNLECIGGGPRLGYAAREWTRAGWRRADAVVVHALQAAAGGELGAIAAPVFTDAGPLVRAGIPAVTLVGLDAAGAPPRRLHRPADRLAALDPSGIDRAGAIVRRVLTDADRDVLR